MNVRVVMDIAGRNIDEMVSGETADEILSKAKARVEKELGWKGIFLKAMSPLGFAQEAVRRYNAATNSNYEIPNSADEFIELGKDLGYIIEVPE